MTPTRTTAVDPFETACVALVAVAVALVALGAYAIGASLGLPDPLGGSADRRVIGTLAFGLVTVTLVILLSGSRPFGRSPQR